MLTSSSPHTCPPPPTPHLSKFIVDVAFSARISQLSLSACSALGDIFRSGPLPLPVGSRPQSAKDNGEREREVQPPSSIKDDMVCSSTDELTQRDLVSSLSKILKSAKEIKVRTLYILKEFSSKCP